MCYLRSLPETRGAGSLPLDGSMREVTMRRYASCLVTVGAALLADESLGGEGTPAVAAFTPV